MPPRRRSTPTPITADYDDDLPSEADRDWVAEFNQLMRWLRERDFHELARGLWVNQVRELSDFPLPDEEARANTAAITHLYNLVSNGPTGLPPDQATEFRALRSRAIESARMKNVRLSATLQRRAALRPATEAAIREARNQQRQLLEEEVGHKPGWIRELFGAKQFLILDALWGQSEVAAEALMKLLSYNGETAIGNLIRRVAETNANLCERAGTIGGQWQISRRTRGLGLFFYLHQEN